MKKLILLLMACSVIANLTALEWDSTVQMPAREVLKDRLCAAGFDHFEEHTNLSERLTRTPVSLGSVAVAVDSALFNYNQYVGNPMIARLMLVRKPKLLEVVLQDTPGAVTVIDRKLTDYLTDRK